MCIRDSAGAVARRAARALAALRHDGGGGGKGAPVVVFHGARWTELELELELAGRDGGVGDEGREREREREDEDEKCVTPPTARGVSAGGVVGQGPTVAFSVIRPDGTYVGYSAVERLAAAAGVHVRTGCCCNPGAVSYTHLTLPTILLV